MVILFSFQLNVCKAVNSGHPNSKVDGANMGLTWGRQDPGGPHVGPSTLLSGQGNID